MKKQISVSLMGFGILVASTSFAQNLTVGASEASILASIQTKVNGCLCGGTPEACCKACPETCSALNAVDLKLTRDTDTGLLKAIAK